MDHITGDPWVSRIQKGNVRRVEVSMP
uniref:Uncharacterized protein n=1 Tax=Arundo donax TaxID=35708 RepID=A0A0A8ZNH1_ARUDO